MAGRHFLVTSLFWVVVVVVGWSGSRYLAARWPSSGDILGVLGAMALVYPTVSDMAWDILSRRGGKPLGPGGKPLPTSEGYAPFSWKRACWHAIGVALIGLGFGVNFLSSKPS